MTDKHFDKKTSYIVIISVLLIVIGVLAFILFRLNNDQVVTDKDRDPNASVGQYDGKTQEEIQAELDKIVEEGMFNVSINSTVIMAKGSDEAELRIENIANNHHLMSVEIKLDDTGKVIYTSGLIEPGYYIQSVPLKVKLSKGSHAATAIFTAYDLDTEAPVGQVSVKITITVQK